MNSPGILPRRWSCPPCTRWTRAWRRRSRRPPWWSSGRPPGRADYPPEGPWGLASRSEESLDLERTRHSRKFQFSGKLFTFQELLKSPLHSSSSLLFPTPPLRSSYPLLLFTPPLNSSFVGLLRSRPRTSSSHHPTLAITSTKEKSVSYTHLTLPTRSYV